METLLLGRKRKMARVEPGGSKLKFVARVAAVVLWWDLGHAIFNAEGVAGKLSIEMLS